MEITSEVANTITAAIRDRIEFTKNQIKISDTLLIAAINHDEIIFFEHDINYWKSELEKAYNARLSWQNIQPKITNTAL